MGRSDSIDLERAAMLTHVKRLQDERVIGLDFNVDWVDGALRLYSAVGGSPQEILRAIAAANGDPGAAQRALVTPDRPSPGVDSVQEQDLRAELASCGLKELRKRAADLGVSDASLEEALDADVPKQAVTELIVQASALAEPINAGPSREELMAMRLSALRKLALDLGLPEDSTEDALDQDSPKEALVELVISFRSTGASTGAPPAAPAPTPAPYSAPAPAPYRAPAPAPAHYGTGYHPAPAPAPAPAPVPTSGSQSFVVTCPVSPAHVHLCCHCNLSLTHARVLGFCLACSLRCQLVHRSASKPQTASSSK